MSSFRTLDDLGDITGKVALVRVDLNLPMKDGSATDVTRVEAVKPTILELADKGAEVLLLAQFGRPKGQRHSTMSTSFVQGDVEKVLDKEIMFIPEVMGPVVEQSIGILRDGDIGLLDNVRFWPGEEANDPEFARGIAAHGDFYVNDAFSAAHSARERTVRGGEGVRARRDDLATFLRLSFVLSRGEPSELCIASRRAA